MNDTQLSGKELYEMKKREREAGRQKPAGGSGKSAKRISTYAIVIAIFAIIIYGGYLWAKSLAPKTEDLSRAIPIQGWDHIEVGAEHEPYNSNPPTSGPHYGQPARPGFRGGEEIADENLIHSLEHGLVWISYRPDVSADVVKVLEDFDTGLVVITERAANDADIALASWGRLDTFDVGDTLTEEEAQRIKDFITRYANHGREQIPPGQHYGI